MYIILPIMTISIQLQPLSYNELFTQTPTNLYILLISSNTYEDTTYRQQKNW